MFSHDDFSDPAPHLILLALASMAAVECWVALWVATSSRHWFWRALAVWAAVTALLPIRAYDPALVFAVSSPLTIAVIQSLWRGASWWGRQRAPIETRKVSVFRFKLSTLLLLILLLGLTLSSLLYVRKHMSPLAWWMVLLPAVVIAIESCLVYWLARGPRRIGAAILLAPIVPLAAWLLWPNVKWLYKWDALGMWMYEAMASSDTYTNGLVATIVGQSELIGLLLFALVPVPNLSRAKWLASTLKFSRNLAFVAGAIGLAVVYGSMLRFSPLPPPPQARLNHTDEILQIASRVKAINPIPQALAEIVAADPQSAAAVELGELYERLGKLLGADNTLVLRLEDCTDAFFSGPHMDQFQACRHLARALQAEIKSAVGAGDLARAAHFARGNVRLGTMYSRGGLYVDLLVGNAIFMTGGLPELARFRERLDVEAARTVIAELGRCEEEIESLDVITRRDVAFCQRAFGWTTHLEQVIGLWVRGTIEDPVDMESTIKARARTATVLHLLEADLAIRLFQSDHQELPETLRELVPEYLPELPLDMLGNGPLVYRRADDGFVLYSVGKDGVDGGGRFTNWPTHNLEDGYDLDLDTFKRP